MDVKTDTQTQNLQSPGQVYLDLEGDMHRYNQIHR